MRRGLKRVLRGLGWAVLVVLSAISLYFYAGLLVLCFVRGCLGHG